MEIARDEVRVMTVHGAKGLEAPIVVLADTTTPPAGPGAIPAAAARRCRAQAAAPRHADRFVWMPLQEGRHRADRAGARRMDRRRSENEYRRLLYVAMTRAADRLMVCGVDRRERRCRPAAGTS